MDIQDKTLYKNRLDQAIKFTKYNNKYRINKISINKIFKRKKLNIDISGQKNVVFNHIL